MQSNTNPIIPAETSMDAAADPAANVPSAPLARVPTAEHSLPRLVSTGGSETAADGCIHGSNAAASAKFPVPEPKKRSKSAGFFCCMGAPDTAGDSEFARVRGGSDGAIGAAARADAASGGDGNGISEVDSDVTVGGNEGSRSFAGSRAAGSLKGGMQMLWRRRNNTLPPIALFADVDTAHEALPLSTVSESTDSEHHVNAASSGGALGAPPKADVGAAAGPRDGGAAVAAAPSPDDPRASLDMSFEPSADTVARRRDVLWHTVSHESPDATTRPHPHLAYSLPPRPPRGRPPPDAEE